MQTGTTRTPDQLTLHTLDSPVENPKGVVYLVHGINEHIGRYAHVISFLNSRGYAVYGHDHRGHGRSEGERALFESFDHPVADLKARIDAVRAKHPGQPVFVYGHSMGSLISMLYVAAHGDAIAGWISTGSPLWVDKAVPGVVQSVLGALARVFPSAKVLPINPSTVSRDPAVVATYTADPLNTIERTKLGMAARFSAAVRRARTLAQQIRVPVLIVHGEGDTLTPIEGSRYLHENIGSQDKSFLSVPQAYHEVHNEPEQEAVLNAIADWLDARTAGQRSAGSSGTQ